VTEPASPAEGTDADVIVVGAGPGGSTAAFHLAQAGLDVLLLEKSGFPREKVCGDGLTPRAVKQLVTMGVDTEAAGWRRNEGLRIIGGGHTLELPWPELTSFPGYGLTCTRATFDETLARHAAKAGARLHEHANVTGPVVDERTGRITGVTVKHTDSDSPVERTYRAPLVLAADGNSTRLSLAMGLRRREDRPMGVAVRTYYTSPRHDEDWLESHLELWDAPEGAPDRHLLPGYGWIFPMGDGTCNVGLGILDTSKAFQNVDYRDLLKRWLEQTPEEWGFREATRTQPIRGAALPMGFNRTPHYTNGLMLLGDAGGMVNPFNGEGIAYAMESGALAADVVAQALAARTGVERERALHAYPSTLKATYGGYYTLGRMFVKLIGHPEVMRLATKHGLGHRSLMQLTLKMLANLTEPRGGDVHDRLVNGLSRVAPSA
jgi:geranylgeranyl reductase family protein